MASFRIRSIVNVSSIETYFFYNDKVIKYNNDTNNSVGEDLNSNFKGIPKDFEVAFIDTEEVPLPGNPKPVIIFVKDKLYYRYSLATSKLLNDSPLIFRDRLLETNVILFV